jgi:hypothetical protein
VPQLSCDVRAVQARGDEDARVGRAEVVEAQPALPVRVQARLGGGLDETLRQVAVMDGQSLGQRAEDVVRVLGDAEGELALPAPLEEDNELGGRA